MRGVAGTLRATAADAAPCAFAPRGQATSRSAIGQAGNIVRLVVLVRPRSRAAAPFVGRDPFSARFIPTPFSTKPDAFAGLSRCRVYKHRQRRRAASDD